METISPGQVRTALCDQEGFYPFRSLLTGHVSSIEELAQAERFVRAVVLHDAIEMDGEPLPSQEDEHEWSEEEIAAGGRNVIVAFMPDLSQYGDLFVNNLGPDRLDTTRLELSDALRGLASQMSGAGPGDVYYEAHLKYLYRLTRTLRDGASIVCGGQVGLALRATASEYPEALFSMLDADLQSFARAAQEAHVGVVVPPVLSIILSRIRSRDGILQALRELRAEWKEPRDRVWKLVDALRTSSDVREMQAIKGELEQASRVFSPARDAVLIEPSRILWDLVTDAVVVVAATATGDRATQAAAVVGAVSHVMTNSAVPAANYIFRRGAFDLARRVRTEVIRAARVPDLLYRFLSEEGRRALSA